MEVYKIYYRSEIGIIQISGNEDGICGVEYLNEGTEIPSEGNRVPTLLEDCRNQLDEYFKRKREVFNVKLQLTGTEFQKSVWTELMKIPFGRTVSYKDIAMGIGNVNAVRAVGGANGRNRINIIIPCHRVIGSNSNLTGYGGGLWRKEWLLKHEQRQMPAAPDCY